MRQKMLTEEQIRDELKAMVEADGLSETARTLEISPGFIWDVVRGNRGVSVRLAKAMGYEKLQRYQRLPAEECA